MTARTCLDCPNPISRLSKGRCRRCSAIHLNTDPAMVALRTSGQQAYFARPGVKAAHAARLAHHLATMSDEERQRRREHGRTIAAQLHTPMAKARSNSPEAKAIAGRKRTDTVLAWCPPAYRDRYRKLKNTNLIRAAEARAMIEVEIASDERKRVAAMTPFERQLERVRNGAQLVARPETRPIGPSMTLGGVASGAL